MLEVVDVYDGKGKPVGAQHNLVWLSHTYDVQHRRYRYTSASYFTGPGRQAYVAALVDQRPPGRLPLPATATGQLDPATTDAPGSSLVLLDYDPGSSLGTAGFGRNGQANGFIPTPSAPTSFLQPAGSSTSTAPPS